MIHLEKIGKNSESEVKQELSSLKSLNFENLYNKLCCYMYKMNICYFNKIGRYMVLIYPLANEITISSYKFILEIKSQNYSSKGWY